MQAKKLNVSKDVVHIVRELCAVVFNVKTKEQLEKIFGIKLEQMEAVIQQIINALPDYLFEPPYEKKLDEIEHICAREYVFFQAQEKWGDPNYAQNLLNFTYIFSRDIQDKLKSELIASSKTKSRMKQE